MPQSDNAPNPNAQRQSAGDALNAGVAENLMGVGDATVSVDEQQLAVPLYQPPGRRAAASFIFLTITLDMLALGMIAPVLPRLIAGFMAGNASSAARMLGYFGAVFAVMNFFFSPVLGSLSDRFGRRPVVLLSNFGLGLDYLLMAWAPALGWLFVGRIISGVTASSVPTGMAYMTDVTPPEKRAGVFGLLGAAFGVGFVLGPAMGGILGSVSPRLPFWVAGGLSLLNGMYGLFVLPESLRHEHRSPFSWKNANPLGSLRLLRNNKILLGLAAVLVLGYLAQQSLMNVYVIFADYRFHWSDRAVGLSLALVGVIQGFYGAGLVKPVVKRLGERSALSFGLIGGTIGYIMIGISRTGILMLCGIPVLNLMSVAWPSAQSIMSREVKPSEQGQMQGAVQSLRGLSGIFGPVMFTWVFSKTFGPAAAIQMPGAAFFLASALLVVSLIVAQMVRPRAAAASPAA
jgi:DHA1 family tetracycline resistance protein-like MFS transporter